MKRIVLLLCVLLLLSCIGCSKSQNDYSSLIAICAGKAQEYIDAEDYTSAIDILEDGIEATQSPELMEMLESVQKTMEAQSETEADSDSNIIACPMCGAECRDGAKFCSACGASLEITVDSSGENQADEQKADELFDLSNYASEVTYWATESTSWIYGGYALGIYIDEEVGENACFELAFTQSAPASRVAVAYAEIPLSKIADNEITFAFENDGWGHSGTVTLILMDETVMFTISDVAYTDSSCPEMWGFYDTTGVLISNPGVYDDLCYTQEEYDALFGDNDADATTSSEPVYDTSKASGILASLGMTEQEFKDSCALIASHITSNIDKVLYSDLITYPGNYIGGFFYDKAFSVSKYILESDDGYRVYEYDSYYCNALVFDCRDDIYNPTITGGYVGMYMRFIGIKTVNGTDYAAFELIAIDKK